MAVSDQEMQRREKLDWIREQGIEPYPARCKRTHTTQQVRDAFEAAEAQASAPEDQAAAAAEIVVHVAGRLVSVRDMGKSIFCHIEDEQGRLQIYVRKSNVAEQSFELFKRHSDLGDFYGFMSGYFSFFVFYSVRYEIQKTRSPRQRIRETPMGRPFLYLDPPRRLRPGRGR